MPAAPSYQPPVAVVPCQFFAVWSAPQVPGCTPQTTQAPAGRKLLHVPMV